MVACCSINMRIFKTTELILLLFFIVCSSSAAPRRDPHALNSSIDSPASTDLEESTETIDHYDQRQNGTDNFRVHVDGLVVVVAPVEALLLAGSIPGISNSNIFGISQGGIIEPPAEPRPKPAEKPEAVPEPVSDAKPEAFKDIHLDAKSAHRPGIRLMNLLSPFLRKIQSYH